MQQSRRFHSRGHLVLVGERAVRAFLEKGHHGKPLFGAGPRGVARVGRGVRRVGDGVVRLECARGDVEAHEDVERVVLVRRQDEEHARAVEGGAHVVQEVPGLRRVRHDEAVQDGQHRRVPRKHVVAAGSRA